MSFCRVITKTGQRCKNHPRAGFGGFCSTHVRQIASLSSKPEATRKKSRSSQGLELIGAAAAIGVLAELVVRLIKAIDFFDEPSLFEKASQTVAMSQRLLCVDEKQPKRISDEMAEQFDRTVDAWLSEMPESALAVIFAGLDQPDNYDNLDREGFESELQRALAV